MASQVVTNDFAQGTPNTASHLSHSNLHAQNSQFDELAAPADSGPMQRTPSSMSQSYTLTPSRGGTLKKRQSLSRKNSLKRTGSRKGSRPGSIKSFTYAEDAAGGESSNAFYTPVPTHGSPTEILANRFQGMFRVELRGLHRRLSLFASLEKGA